MLQTLHHPIATKPFKESAGFSLVEIMVAMVIGLLGMLIMLQVYSNSEAQKRITAGGDDAQNAGAIALYGLQRDIQQSGWGISSINLLGCNVLLPTGVTLNSIAPTTINHASITGQDANTDTLVIVSGNGNGGQEGDTVTSQLLGNTIYTVASPNEFAVNDRVIARPTALPAACTLDTVTAVAGANVTVQTGLAGMTDGTLHNLGQTQKIRAYAIRSGNLTVCDYTINDCGLAANNGNTAIWVPIANNIVSMKAQYGRDTAANAMVGVDIYDTTTPTTANCWINTSSIRIALVARNSQSTQAGVTAAAPIWEGTSTVAASAPLPANVADPIDISSSNANWQNYRYKVFQTIVPIRNITVQGAQTGC
ncbi:MAG: PilW family protein [Gallionella sp.]|nr:PilW family protein [Gallionella sp.]